MSYFFPTDKEKIFNSLNHLKEEIRQIRRELSSIDYNSSCTKKLLEELKNAPLEDKFHEINMRTGINITKISNPAEDYLSLFVLILRRLEKIERNK